VRSAACLLAALVWASRPARADDARRLDVAVLPGLAFASDTGFGFGVNGSVYRRAPDRLPWAWAVKASLFFTTRGVQDHALAADLVGERHRGTFALGYFRDRYRPYVGIGNETDDAVPAGRTADDYLTYDLRAPFAQAAGERRLGAWRVAAAYDLRWMSTTLLPGSRIAAEAPTGADGGWCGRVDLELAHDTRDREASPSTGHYGAVSAHAALPLLGSAFTYGGLAGEWRGFYSGFRNPTALVLAARLLGSVTWGDVPVAQLTWFGGRSRVEGLGGSDTLRGLPRFRYAGQAKVVGNVEVRSRVRRFTVRERPLDVWLVAFGDAGRAWARVAADGPWWRLHGAAGVGLRLAWVEDFVARVDVGFGEGDWAVYATLDQLF
jgi:hypothetical protein